jgi:hypothetical protein
MVGAIFALGFVAFAKTPPPAAVPASRVFVRVDTGAARKIVQLDAVIRSVTAIWKPYADITFADASDHTKGGSSDEPHLVVTERAQFDAAGAPALGWISFVKPGQPLNLITVSVAAARALMAHSTWLGQPFGQLPPFLQQDLVARAISWSAAHEIGHYLLRTSGHSRNGLMRAQLTASEVMRKDRLGTRLEPADIERLRERASLAGLLADVDAPAPRSE